VCVWNYVCVHVYYICMFVHIHTCMYVFRDLMHIYKHTGIHAYECIAYAHACKYGCLHTYVGYIIHACIYKQMHTRIHTYTFAYRYTHMHTYICLYRGVCLSSQGFLSGGFLSRRFCPWWFSFVPPSVRIHPLQQKVQFHVS